MRKNNYISALEKSLEAHGPGNKEGKQVGEFTNYLPAVGLYATGVSQTSTQKMLRRHIQEGMILPAGLGVILLFGASISFNSNRVRVV